MFNLLFPWLMIGEVRLKVSRTKEIRLKGLAAPNPEPQYPEALKC